MTFRKKITISSLFVSVVIFAVYVYSTAQAPESYLVSDVQKLAPKKIFIVDGELSGDRIAAWYIHALKQRHHNLTCEAIGEQFLAQEEVKLLHNFTTLRSGIRIASGIFNYIKNIPTCIDLFHQVTDYILMHNFDHIILVDAPFITIPLARALKKRCRSLHITYIAPPELWFWGTWHIDKVIKKYCDKIIVIYPFEVAWYKKIGLPVEWLGYPFYEEFLPYLLHEQAKEKCIALLPGSRQGEMTTMMPILASFIKQFHAQYPDVAFILPLAESFTVESMNNLLQQYDIINSVKIITGTSEKKNALSKCCFAITKPGTVTLDLALLKVPSIITYKVSWATYLFIRFTANPVYVGLPNLFSGREICKELLQEDCNAQTLLREALTLYRAFLTKDALYQQKLDDLEALRQTFIHEWQSFSD